MGESNACMHRIVAAPTAGACGVLPAVLLPIYSRKTASDTEITEACTTAAGDRGRCASRALLQVRQAVVRLKSARHRQWLRGRWYPSGEERQSRSHMRLLWRSKIFSGLVCDPVAGLVEVPCVKRKVIGAVNAVSSADMALAGIVSRIPPDQVIDAMKEVGESMHIFLKETGEGGEANTPEARKIKFNLNLPMT